MRIFILMLILFTVSGCGQDSGPNVQTVDECTVTPIRNKNFEEKAVTIAKGVNGIDDATALFVDNQLSLAIKASNFNMFKIETLEKEAFNKLKKDFPNTNIFVSDDMKYFMELEEINKKEWPKTKTKGCKQLKKIKKLEGNLQN